MLIAMNTTMVWPILSFRDAHKSAAFLRDAFGFEETSVHGDGTTVQHAELSWPEGGGIMLGSARTDPVPHAYADAYAESRSDAERHARAGPALGDPGLGPAAAA